MTENQFSEAMAARRESAKIDDEASKALAALMTITVPSLPPYLANALAKTVIASIAEGGIPHLSVTAGRIARKIMLGDDNLKFKMAFEALRMIRDAKPPPGIEFPETWCIGYMREWASSTITLLDEMERNENA